MQSSNKGYVGIYIYICIYIFVIKVILLVKSKSDISNNAF